MCFLLSAPQSPTNIRGRHGGAGLAAERLATGRTRAFFAMDRLGDSPGSALQHAGLSPVPLRLLAYFTTSFLC